VNRAALVPPSHQDPGHFLRQRSRQVWKGIRHFTKRQVGRSLNIKHNCNEQNASGMVVVVSPPSRIPSQEEGKKSRGERVSLTAGLEGDVGTESGVNVEVTGFVQERQAGHMSHSLDGNFTLGGSPVVRVEDLDRRVVGRAGGGEPRVNQCLSHQIL